MFSFTYYLDHTMIITARQSTIGNFLINMTMEYNCIQKVNHGTHTNRSNKIILLSFLTYEQTKWQPKVVDMECNNLT